MRKAQVYIALLHYPMYNKRMDLVATSVSNLDLHDIARAARTYDVDGFFVIHPAASQRELIKRVIAYWQDGYGGSYNADRKEAFSLIHLAQNYQEVIEALVREKGQKVFTIATDAKPYPNTVNYLQMREKIYQEEKVFVILFGTGWGMAQELVSSCDYVLEPIVGSSDYNHLSVRSAVSIIMDRLLGQSWFEKPAFS